MERWSDKVAVVTGASAGIGAAIVQKLVEKGLQVVGLARRLDRLHSLNDTLKNSSGTFYPLKVDIKNTTEIDNAIEWIKKHLGQVDILINNAGVASATSFLDATNEDFKHVLDTNILGGTILTRDVINKLMPQTKQSDDKKSKAHIIFVNSIAGHTVLNVPYNNLYPASKFAITAIVETLRQEFCRQNMRINVTSLSPGLVETEIFAASGMLEKSEAIKLLSGEPAMKSEDVAEAVLYILGTSPSVQVSELIIRPSGGYF